MTNLTLWNSIKSFDLDDLESSFSFTDRLCRENLWTREFAIRAIHEYKKFMYLICISSTPLTPSDEVDQVWHLHLLYTHSYWKEFCGDVLGKEIHHGPTKGGEEQRITFKNAYQDTKEKYEYEFETPCPKDIWPSSQVRFSKANFVRVNKENVVILSKPWK